MGNAGRKPSATRLYAEDMGLIGIAGKKKIRNLGGVDRLLSCSDDARTVLENSLKWRAVPYRSTASVIRGGRARWWDGYFSDEGAAHEVAWLMTRITGDATKVFHLAKDRWEVWRHTGTKWVRA